MLERYYERAYTVGVAIVLEVQKFKEERNSVLVNEKRKRKSNATAPLLETRKKEEKYKSTRESILLR